MLVLIRRKKESIIIGDGIIEVKIVEIEKYVTADNFISYRVRVGIQAPPSISVHRKEIYRKIQKERAQEPGKLEQTTSQRQQEQAQIDAYEQVRRHLDSYSPRIKYQEILDILQKK